MSTKKTWTSLVKIYFRFCMHLALTPVPVSWSTLLRYCPFLARSISANSIPDNLNVVEFLDLEPGLDHPLCDWPFAMVKKRVFRSKGKPPMQKLAITMQILVGIYERLNMICHFNVAFLTCMCDSVLHLLQKVNLASAQFWNRYE